jgi:hypothetical protein
LQQARSEGAESATAELRKQSAEFVKTVKELQVQILLETFVGNSIMTDFWMMNFFCVKIFAGVVGSTAAHM